MITIMLNNVNAAFEDNHGGEVARILRRLADQAEQGDLGDTCRLLDINGNTVGTFRNDLIGAS